MNGMQRGSMYEKTEYRDRDREKRVSQPRGGCHAPRPYGTDEGTILESKSLTQGVYTIFGPFL